MNTTLSGSDAAVMPQSAAVAATVARYCPELLACARSRPIASGLVDVVDGNWV
jgi:hypothetical protein